MVANPVLCTTRKRMKSFLVEAFERDEFLKVLKLNLNCAQMEQATMTGNTTLYKKITVKPGKPKPSETEEWTESIHTFDDNYSENVRNV